MFFEILCSILPSEFCLVLWKKISTRMANNPFWDFVKIKNYIFYKKICIWHIVCFFVKLYCTSIRDVNPHYRGCWPDFNFEINNLVICECDSWPVRLHISHNVQRLSSIIFISNIFNKKYLLLALREAEAIMFTSELEFTGKFHGRKDISVPYLVFQFQHWISEIWTAKTVAI